ncbi:hypothetical protein [Streptomyces sp. B93]|uniref:hypothetical protein n=1 Tax=Streptomyces sp. B93 TaxID=2824875 RepID=UPI0027E3FD57|nr:hypothetical protein [Streptomyces sp. B93]
MADATERTPAIPAALSDPLLNHGVGFTEAEREALGPTGRLASVVLTLEQQAERAYRQLQAHGDSLAKNAYLEQLHDRDETLYFKILRDHLAELLPIVYDPTVGEAIKRYSHKYRRPRGVFLSIDRPDDIEKAFRTLGLGPDDVDLIVCSDAEQILGIGDWGVGGVQIAVGKLAVYTAAVGIDPSRVIAVSLDVGTDRESLLKDPLYLGNRFPRVRGPSTTPSSSSTCAPRPPCSPAPCCTSRTSARQRPPRPGAVPRLQRRGTGHRRHRAGCDTRSRAGQRHPDARPASGRLRQRHRRRRRPAARRDGP